MIPPTPPFEMRHRRRLAQTAWNTRASPAILPPAAERLPTLQSWDTANKGGPESDWSVCTTWIMTRKKQWYLVDVWRRRVDYPTLKTAFQTHAERWNARRVLVEDAGTGTALVAGVAGNGLGHHRREAGGRQSKQNGSGLGEV
jgi:phage terminase large subunit-like protein